MASNNDRVLVTGGSGFIAMWCIIQCLHAGYQVRATVRSLKRVESIVQALRSAGAPNPDTVIFKEADLLQDDGWKEAVEDCTYVLHVADASVKRVVVTSSFAAIGQGHRGRDPQKPFTEEDWTDLDGPGVGAYEKSKTIAERAAWDFIEKEGGSLELSVVNPVSVMGPILGPEISTSIQVASRLLSGAIPGCPNIEFGVVDVRDVADLHLLAMTHPRAKGERFLCMSPPAMSIRDIALTLRDRMGSQARKVPTRTIPNFVLRSLAFFDSGIALVVPYLDEARPGSIEKAKTLLGWNPRSNADAVVASAESLIRHGVVNV
ncbi:hypothetical protein POX_b02732 [Penicillium oxalicum]|uniref:hypothetical protein n=1 Tax=Penicillium oxalicum TaxID=69781 RepID=UPI0020B7F2C4|nr:hypothetical protein POX_b02732 [Penicillium oxalicum]KAI2792691.1 hypothetical protein POX_b02732 [Penicillium oxalicum]